MIIRLYCIRVFIYICYDEFHWGKEDKMRGGCEKKLRGRYAGEGKEDKMWGGGVLQKTFEGGGVCRRG